MSSNHTELSREQHVRLECLKLVMAYASGWTAESSAINTMTTLSEAVLEGKQDA